ncbi:MAG: tRNA pseudouridine(55) synthase TruB [Rikenellaceae bacterium]
MAEINVNMSHDIEGYDMTQGYVAMVDKPLGWTSTDVVRKIKFALGKCGYRKIKIGHAGTLDPLATGVLLICIGKATKMVDALQSEQKEYIAEVVLGATTPSYDMEHPVDKRYPTEHITREAIDQALQELTGERLQTPPLYSAKRIDGVRAYEAARAGEVVEMRQALINIYGMELLDCNLDPASEEKVLKIRVECSKGTYIRSLAFEIGEKLNSGAYLKSLRRTRSGSNDIEKGSWKLEELLTKLYAIYNVDTSQFEDRDPTKRHRTIEAVAQ